MGCRSEDFVLETRQAEQDIITSEERQYDKGKSEGLVEGEQIGIAKGEQIGGVQSTNKKRDRPHKNFLIMLCCSGHHTTKL